MPAEEKQGIREADSASKRQKKTEASPDQRNLTSLTKSSSTSSHVPDTNEMSDESNKRRNLHDACDDISVDDLQEVAHMQLRSNRLLLKGRTDDDKKRAVVQFLTDRSNVQWLPTCCICHEKRISDDLNVKDETRSHKKIISWSKCLHPM